MNHERTCARCQEPVGPAEVGMPMHSGWMHRDCVIRLIVGGVNHQRGLCLCCGGDQPPDPPSLTEREAATVAAKYYRLHCKEIEA